MNKGVNRFNPMAARQDSVRARITPEEAAILELLGGAGIQNPNTGNYHFYQEQGGGNDANDSSGSDNTGNSGDGGSDDSYSRNYAAMGEAYKGWKAKEPARVGGGDILGAVLSRGKTLPSLMNKASTYSKWGKTAPYGSTSTSVESNVQGRQAGDHDVTGGGITGTSMGPGYTTGAGGAGGAGGPIYPSVYTDPVTGRLLYQSQSVGGTSNLSYADQQLLDQLMGTNVASQNVQQQVGLLNDTIKKLKAAGADTSYYEQELARLQGLGSQSVSATNPLLQAVNSGASARAANQLTENTVANQLRAGEEAQARRGMGTLGSPMNDQLRASLGLSTAQARTQNQSAAEKEALANRMSIMSLLKNSQNQDYTQEMGRTGIGMTLGDWENQRKIAEIAQANQNSQFGQNMDYMQGLQDDANRNAWINTIGDVAGSVDWGSFF